MVLYTILEEGLLMDIFSIIVGFIFGVIIVAIIVEISLKKPTTNTPNSRHTKNWSFEEIDNPRIMAEYLANVEIPKNSRVIVNRYKDKSILAGLNAKENKEIKGNFILGNDRALILAGPVHKNEVGFWTVEKDIIRELNREFEESWMKGEKIEEDKPEK